MPVRSRNLGMAAPCCPICSRRYCAVSRHLWTPFVLPLSTALFDLRVAWLFRSDPPGLVLREQLGRRSPARLLLEIEIAEILPAGVFHDEGIVADLFDRPGRREAVRVHSISRLPIFWRLAPFPFAGLPVVAGDTTLNHFIAPFVACHDERDEVAAAKTKPAKGGHDNELRQLTHPRPVLFKTGGGKGREDIFWRPSILGLPRFRNSV